MLAVAALLPDRVAAAAALCSVAPFDAEGLDFTAGMGEQNVVSMAAAQADEATHRANHELELANVLNATPEQLVEAWTTLLGPADREVLTGSLAEGILAEIRAGIVPSSDGWFDDDRCFVRPWGFDVASIRIPVLVWQGEQDRFVPFAHGEWLAAHIPGAEARLEGGSTATSRSSSAACRRCTRGCSSVSPRTTEGPSRGPQSLYGSTTSRPAIATPSGRSVCFTRIESPCAASTSGRRL